MEMPAGAALPQGDGRAPVPLPRDGPVHVVPQPLPEAAFLDVVRVPAYLLVAADETILEGGGAYVPGGLGVVEQGGVAPPAEGIRVVVHLLPVQVAPVLEVGHDVLVGLLHELAGEGVSAGDDAPQVHGLDEVQALLPAGRQVLVAEGRGNVHNARAVLQGNEVRVEHTWAVLLGNFHRSHAGRGSHLGGVRGIAARKAPDLDAILPGIVQAVVGEAHQRGAPECVHHLAGLPNDLLHQGGSEDEPLGAPGPLQLHQAVLRRGVYRQPGVAGEGPGCGGPGQEVGGHRALSRMPGERRVLPDPELDEHRRVGGVLLVSQGHLVGAEAGDAPGDSGGCP